MTLAAPAGQEVLEAPAIVQAEGLTRTYRDGDGTLVHALRAVCLRVHPGELVAVVGPSGSGKSTLLQLLGGLDTPTSGSLQVAGTEVTDLSEAERTRYRLRCVGFVFQSFFLVPSMTVLENVALTAIVDNRTAKQWEHQALAVLDDLGLLDLADRYPSTLSGGQRQRVAVGRALFARPPVLLADEPTGNLDAASGESVLGLLRGAVSPESGACGVLVTHDLRAAGWCDRVVVLRDGAIVDELRLTEPGGPDDGRGRPTDHADRIRTWMATAAS